MSYPSQSTQLAEFHNVILTTQFVEFLVSSNSPSSPVQILQLPSLNLVTTKPCSNFNALKLNTWYRLVE
jgi:hypothetical protein